MAANRFASLLHRHTHRTAMILVYTVLEWTLIVLLLINGLFSYLIAKFAAFFGLHPPCLFCSRVDHIFEPDRSHLDMLCDDHVAVLSGMVALKASRGALGATQKANLMGDISEEEEDQPDSPQIGEMGCAQEAILDSSLHAEAVSLDAHTLYSREILDANEGRLLPLELIDSATMMDNPTLLPLIREDDTEIVHNFVDIDSSDQVMVPVEVIEDKTFSDLFKLVDSMELHSAEQMTGSASSEEIEIKSCPVLEIVDIAEDHSSVAVAVANHQCDIPQIDAIHQLYVDAEVETLPAAEDSGELQAASKEETNVLGSEDNCVVLIDNGIRDQEHIGLPHHIDMISVPVADMESIAKGSEANCEMPMSSTVRDREIINQFQCDELVSVPVPEEESKSIDIEVPISNELVPVLFAEEESKAVDSKVPISSETFVQKHINQSHYEDLVSVPTAEDETKVMDSEANCGILTSSEIYDHEHIDQSHLEKLVYVPAAEEENQTMDSEANCEISIGSDICDQEHVDKLPCDELVSVPVTEDESKTMHSDTNCEISRGSETWDQEHIEQSHCDELVSAPATVEDSKVSDSEANCEISIGSEICDQEHIDQSHFDEVVSVPAAVEILSLEDHSQTTDRGQVVETGSMESILRVADRLSVCPELNEVEEDRAPDTPTSIEGFHAPYKRFFFERKDSGTESWDGSVASEFEGGDTLTVEQLKSALKTEHKALSALYAELEEERSASAIAANQTMAMITRIQEEKAAMQMEALQYQRMMEEQSEYDQEALQLLNEQMMKKEREKHELEKELEVYRKKVLHYEAKERRKLAGSKPNGLSGTSSASSSAEDSDDPSFDYHEGDESLNSLDESNPNTSTASILSSGAVQGTARHLITLDESLADFEEERISILNQLKALEEKLITLEEEEPSNNAEGVELLSEGNVHELNGDHGASDKHEEGAMNCFSDDFKANGKLHSEPRGVGYRGKGLLPLFDAISLENKDRTGTKPDDYDASPKSASKLTPDKIKFAFAEEVDNVYERLHALEADREFLKQCIISLRKGDKGTSLLQEILQQLRDLKNIELHVKNAGNILASFSA